MQPTPTSGPQHDTETTAPLPVVPAGLLPGQRPPSEQTTALNEPTSEIPIIVPRERADESPCRRSPPS
ncbi:hypothetical protein ACFQ1L_39130 [Phytohabitans flavus]|nr:hypothetical protein [Phytohabitans flavus]